MKVFQLITLGAAFFNFFLALFVFSRDTRSNTHRVYLLWGIAIALWNLGTFFMFEVASAEDALYWARFLHFGVIFLPAALLHLALLVSQIHIRPSFYLLYGVQSLFALSNFTDGFIADVRHTGYAYYSVAGPLYWPFLAVYGTSAGAALLVLNRRQRDVSPLFRTRLNSLMLAAGILILFGVNDIAPILGVVHYPGTNLQIYPLGSLAAIFYSLIVGYSVLQHQLLDVHVTLGRIAAYVVRLLLMFLVGFSLLLVVAALFPNEFTPISFGGALGVLLMSALLASFFFPRLFGHGDDALVRRILGDRFEYHDKIQGFIQGIPWNSNTDDLLSDLHGLLVKTVQVKSYRIVLQEESSRRGSMSYSYPSSSESNDHYLPPDSPMFDLFVQTGPDYLGLREELAIPGEPTAATDARRQLRDLDSDYCFPFKSGKELFGLMLLGGKKNEEPYTPHDLHLLALLSKNLSNAMNQIRLKEQVAQAQELDMLGRMSQGLAHDMNNLLTPVYTYLQLLREQGAFAAEDAQLHESAVRNLITIQSYIKEALFFSQSREPQFGVDRLDVVIYKVIQIVEPNLNRKNIKITHDMVSGIDVEMDAVLIQRLLSNLLSNAIDASPPKSEIRVELHPMAKKDVVRDWLRLRIIDSGEGVSQTNMKRIFTPFFTTKDRGDETRGFGLGLAVCRKIVNLHGGTLNLFSQETRGTTVQVDLPAHQLVVDEATVAR